MGREEKKRRKKEEMRKGREIKRGMISILTAGIVAMFAQEPLEITVMESAMAATIRIQNNGGWKRGEVKHILTSRF